MNQRKAIIKNLLRSLPFSSIIVKYDYYFSNTVLSDTKELNMWSVTYLKDDRLVIGLKRNIEIRNLNTQEIKTLIGHREEVNIIKTLSDDRIVSGSGDMTLRIWDSNTGNCLHILRGHTSYISEIAILPDDRIVSGEGQGGNGNIRIWNPDTGICEKILADNMGLISSIIVLNNDEIANITQEDNDIRIWNINNGILRIKLLGHTNYIYQLEKYSKNQIISASHDGTIVIWDIKTGNYDKILYIDNAVIIYVLKDMIIAGSSNGLITVWKNEKLYIQIQGHSTQITFFGMLPDNRLISATNNGEIKIWDLDTGTLDMILDKYIKNIMNIKVLKNNQLVIIDIIEDRIIILE